MTRRWWRSLQPRVAVGVAPSVEQGPFSGEMLVATLTGGMHLISGRGAGSILAGLHVTAAETLEPYPLGDLAGGAMVWVPSHSQHAAGGTAIGG